MTIINYRAIIFQSRAITDAYSAGDEIGNKEDKVVGNYSIVTIEREYASGGKEIGQKVADALQIPLYNNEIVSMAAQKLHVDPEYVAHIEEQMTGSMLFNLAMSATSQLGIGTGRSVSDQLFRAECEVIQNFAQQGSCVIVGRCADHVLRNRKDCLNVFIYADLKTRKERAIRQYGVDPSYVESTIKKNDKRRSAYYNVNTSLK